MQTTLVGAESAVTALPGQTEPPRMRTPLGAVVSGVPVMLGPSALFGCWRHDDPATPRLHRATRKAAASRHAVRWRISQVQPQTKGGRVQVGRKFSCLPFQARNL
jgi:hypothetical protein